MKIRKRALQKNRITFRKIAVATALSVVFITAGFFIYLNIATTHEAYAFNSGDYRTKNSGTWSDKNIWQVYNGSTWSNATAAPSGGSKSVYISPGHTVNNSSAQSVDNVIIEATGVLNHTNGTFKINNGNNKDMTVYGILNISGTFTLGTNSDLNIFGTVNKTGGSLTIGNSAKVKIENGGRFKKVNGGMDTAPDQWEVKQGGIYEHADNGNNLPQADWQIGSTCLITGSTNAVPSNLDQDFWNFTWNTPSLNQQKNLSSALKSIKGDFRVVSTGTGSILMNQSSNQTMVIEGNYFHEGGKIGITESGNWVVNIGGMLKIDGGEIKLTDASSSNGSGNPQINIDGNLEVNAGKIDMSQFSGSGSNMGFGKIAIKGNFIMNGGELTESSATLGIGEIIFNGTNEQLYVKTGGNITNQVHYRVTANAILNMADNVVEGEGKFDLDTNGKLVIGSADGIEISGTSGNIQVSGVRTYSTQGYYEYRSTISQNSGTGVPSTMRKLIVANTNTVNISKSISVSDSLILNNGVVMTGSNTLTLGTSVSNTGTLSRNSGSVDGNFKRWISSAPVGNLIFPLSRAGRYVGATMVYTSAPSSAGSVTASFISGTPGTNGLPLVESSVAMLNVGVFGYWNFDRGNGLNGGAFTLNLQGDGFTGINEVPSLRVLTRANASAAWTLTGSHLAGQGTTSSPTVRRAAINVYGQFGIGGNGANPLPISLTKFNAINAGSDVEVIWITATELNNDYFDIERSFDGRSYTSIGRVRGAGTSNKQISYSYADKNPLTGTSYYRLKQTDYDGTSKSFEPKAVKRENEQTSLMLREVYPNPFVGQINCRFQTESNGEVIITINDLNGRLMRNVIVEAYAGYNEIRIEDLDEFSPGYYIINIQMGAEKQSQKILKRN